MEKVAVFVDAGYFWVQLSHIVYGERRRREEISLNARLMRESLLREVKKHFPESSLLRVYWYDGLGLNELPTEQHKSICCLDDIKMRYGTRNSVGQQKGVDGLLNSNHNSSRLLSQAGRHKRPAFSLRRFPSRSKKLSTPLLAQIRRDLVAISAKPQKGVVHFRQKC